MNALDKIISQRDEKEYQKVKSRMILAAKIVDYMKERGITQKKLAEALGKKPSEISRLLAGNHNFTHDTLFDIQYALGVKLLCTEQQENTKKIDSKNIVIMQYGEKTADMFGHSRVVRYAGLHKTCINENSQLN